MCRIFWYNTPEHEIESTKFDNMRQKQTQRKLGAQSYGSKASTGHDCQVAVQKRTTFQLATGSSFLFLSGLN